MNCSETPTPQHKPKRQPFSESPCQSTHRFFSCQLIAGAELILDHNLLYFLKIYCVQNVGRVEWFRDGWCCIDASASLTATEHSNFDVELEMLTALFSMFL